MKNSNEKSDFDYHEKMYNKLLREQKFERKRKEKLKQKMKVIKGINNNE